MWVFRHRALVSSVCSALQFKAIEEPAKSTGAACRWLGTKAQVTAFDKRKLHLRVRLSVISRLSFGRLGCGKRRSNGTDSNPVGELDSGRVLPTARA